MIQLLQTLRTDRNHPHLILIGFKHAGKSVIGKALADRTNLPFIDLDQRIEALFVELFQQQLTCREMVQQRGEPFFRDLESKALASILKEAWSIITVGGGTPMTKANQKLLQSQRLIYIKAPREVVYERIMKSGLPAFFADDKTPRESFETLWEEREKVYEQLADFSVENKGTIKEAVDRILENL
jgi:shikimate kinase